ncbi:hypothetical protein P7K49_040657 [Saguinus oedipus]|uniref:Uncharacterized protein n=1 Tax=Saguinus oedipus TaxID=9490 RepID=A0ABQ9T944_SAGOE|nr:hypothetical protein P7K49_040657 [Saguinus oedipus]
MPALDCHDLESLVTCIQSTLSALYPPFEATAATVLWQLLSVAKRCHSGDRLHCLTSFLLPTKRTLQHLQQEACVSTSPVALRLPNLEELALSLAGQELGPSGHRLSTFL